MKQITNELLEKEYLAAANDQLRLQEAAECDALE